MYLNGSDYCGNDHVLGDSAYPNLTWLLIPFTFRDTGNLTPVQKKYNLTHSAIRSTVERAFGLLKGRFTHSSQHMICSYSYKFHRLPQMLLISMLMLKIWQLEKYLT
ncbi:hypothetical protein MAR_020284 [Mya arenaria]|uniref:DDE Tnp4 domain-containing protein n=1 Tax=Mya arenaria TaxID=6604 RepID=A0ABY7E7I0_MYAAR|nr:hypothetical protein MAR_020284 [Mya arenaria]